MYLYRYVCIYIYRWLRNLVTNNWAFGTNSCSTGFGQVYDDWLLGPQGPRCSQMCKSRQSINIL